MVGNSFQLQNSLHLENSWPRKYKAIILVLMMAPKTSGNAVLGRHHPPVVPHTGTGIIRSTIRYTILAVLSFARVQVSAVGRRNTSVGHQSSRMEPGSQ